MTTRFTPGARRAAFALALVLGFAALGTGCASNGSRSGGSGSGASTGGSGVEVFGTIDAGVSGVRNKSGR